MDAAERKTDAALRRLARKHGLRVHRSQTQKAVRGHGGYQLVKDADNSVEAGADFTLSAKQAMDYITQHYEGRKRWQQPDSRR